MKEMYKKINNDNIFIFGAGGIAKDLYNLLIGCRKKQFMGFIVSNKKKNPDKLFGFPVYERKEIQNDLGDNSIVIVGISLPYAVKIVDFFSAIKVNCFTVDEFMTSYFENITSDLVHNKIIFSNFHGRGLGGNIKYIILELLKKKSSLDIVITVEDKNTIKNDPLLFSLLRNHADNELKTAGIRTVEYGTYDYYYELGTAKVWVDNTHKNVLSKKREGQYYIQTWHGAGPLKKIEHDAKQLPDSYFQMADADVSMTDLYISPAEFTTEQYRRAFRFDGEILECGYPRNDIFINRNMDEGQIRLDLGISLESMVVIYVPTFRESDQGKDAMPDFEMIQQEIEKRYHRSCQILIRFHPDVAKKILLSEDRIGIIDTTDYPDVQELLYISDILITDYSSVMWDFSLQRKPVFMYHPDNEEYTKERGFYLDASELPYIEAVSNEDFAIKLRSFSEKKYLEDLENFFEKYKSFDKGHASEQVADRILEVMTCKK